MAASDYDAMAAFYNQMAEHFKGLAAQNEQPNDNDASASPNNNDITALLVQVRDKLNSWDKRIETMDLRIKKMEGLYTVMAKSLKNNGDDLRKDISTVMYTLCEKMENQSVALKREMGTKFDKLGVDVDGVYNETMDLSSQLEAFTNKYRLRKDTKDREQRMDKAKIKSSNPSFVTSPSTNSGIAPTKPQSVQPAGNKPSILPPGANFFNFNSRTSHTKQDDAHDGETKKVNSTKSLSTDSGKAPTKTNLVSLRARRQQSSSTSSNNSFALSIDKLSGSPLGGAPILKKDTHGRQDLEAEKANSAKGPSTRYTFKLSSTSNGPQSNSKDGENKKTNSIKSLSTEFSVTPTPSLFGQPARQKQPSSSSTTNVSSTPIHISFGKLSIADRPKKALLVGTARMAKSSGISTFPVKPEQDITLGGAAKTTSKAVSEQEATPKLFLERKTTLVSAPRQNNIITTDTKGPSKASEQKTTFLSPPFQDTFATRAEDPAKSRSTSIFSDISKDSVKRSRTSSLSRVSNKDPTKRNGGCP